MYISGTVKCTHGRMLTAAFTTSLLARFGLRWYVVGFRGFKVKVRVRVRVTISCYSCCCCVVVWHAGSDQSHDGVCRAAEFQASWLAGQ